ncbi:hypothetical protein BDE40_0395 [Litoreibacter halocynthiae]|uniref:Capsule biosynthesis protein n=1 Tax=Litoreibacter halocynthiae TaxID=1242689 RepID=A0A4R7LQC5_9RHOB|nr:DUF6356 family protein [Litoreibacter halocynthiae]TDT77116.1 hypothetical protein BDE40_0395 [Litoreibacter halocynthiae]
MSDSTQVSQKQSFFSAMRSHPASVGESYFGHMRFALRFAGLLFAAAGAALVHAVLPALFERTASQMIRRLYAMIETRH